MPIRHRIYVGTIGEGLFRSVDDGATFIRACEGMFVECHVCALAVHPQDARILYLGCEQGLFRSSDAADFWTRVDSPLNGRQIWSILLAPHNPDIILVGTCPSTVFVSTDAGRTWHEGSTSMRPDCPRIQYTRVTSLLADPDDPRTYWAGVEIDGLHRSQDLGRSWQRVGEGLTSQDVHALAKVPNGNFFLATNNDLNVSSDGGMHWKGLNIAGAMPWAYCRALAQVPGRPEVVLLGNGDRPPGCDGALGMSSDGGRTWQPIELPARPNSTMWNFASRLADPGLLYAATVSGQVFRSFDGGHVWHKLGREFGEIRALAWGEEK